MSTRKRPYPGYHEDLSASHTEHKDVIKIAEKIHRRRRQIALHCYLYYVLNENIITDHEYEYLTLGLIDLQTRFPRISESVNFMKRMFIDHDFASTGFHIATYLKSSQSRDAKSIKQRAPHVLLHHQQQKLEVYQSPNVSEKMGVISKRLAIFEAGRE